MSIYCQQYNIKLQLALYITKMIQNLQAVYKWSAILVGVMGNSKVLLRNCRGWEIIGNRERLVLSVEWAKYIIQLT